MGSEEDSDDKLCDSVEVDLIVECSVFFLNSGDRSLHTLLDDEGTANGRDG